MALDKFHAPQSSGTLSDRLSHTSAELTEGCVTYDSTGNLDPQVTLSLVVVDDNYVTIKAVFNRPPVGLVAGNFTITGPVTVDSLEGESQVFLLKLLRTGFGVVSISLPALEVQDEAGDYFPAEGPVTVTLSVRPIPVITGPGQVSVGSTEVSIDFNEVVTGLTIGDFIVSGGSIDTLQGTGNAYTLNLVVAAIDAIPQLVLPAGSCQSVSAQVNVDSNIYTPIVSQGPLVATITPTKAVFNTFTVNFVIRWNAAVGDDFIVGYLAATNATINTLVKRNDSEFLLSLTAVADGQVTVTLAADQFSISGYDNNALATGQCDVDTVDLVFTLTPPTGWLNGLISIPVAGNIANTGLSKSSFVVTNGYASAWEASGNGGTLTVSPVLLGVEAIIHVRIPGGASRSLTGIENAPAGPVTVYHDSATPVLTFTGFSREGSDYLFAVTASELVVQVLGYSHPESSATVVSGNGKSWVIRLTPIAEKGVLQATLPAGMFVDKAFNPTASVTSDSYDFDRVGPTSVWELVEDGHPITRVTNKKLRSFKLTFDSVIQPVVLKPLITSSTGLVVLDVVEITTGLIYRVSTQNNATANQSFLRLPANTVRDSFGNLNEQLSEVIWSFDAVKPVLASWQVAGGNTLKTWTLQFSENIVPNLTESSIIVQGVTVTAVSYGPAQVVITTAVTTTQQGNEVIVGLALPASFVLDAADNGSVATEYLFTTVNTEGPVPMITSDQSPQTVNPFVTFLVEFSEPLENALLAAHLQLVNAVLDPIGVVGTLFEIVTINRVYRVTVKAIEDGEVILRVPAGVVRDFDQNYNREGSLSVTVGSRFTPTLTFDVTDRQDTRTLIVTSAIDIKESTLESTDLVLSSGAFSLAATTVFNRFTLLLDPTRSTAVVTLPADSIENVSDQTNRQAIGSLTYSPITAAATMTTQATSVSASVLFVVKIVWNIQVQGFTKNDLQIGIRTDDQQPIAGTGFVGEVLSMQTLVPGYEYEATCRMTTAPTNFELKVHVWYSRSVGGAVNAVGSPVTPVAFISLPLTSPIVPQFSSPQFPSTDSRLITVSVIFSGGLSRPLVLEDFELINCGVGVAYPGTSFTVSGDERTYTLVVYAFVADDVIVSLPSGVVNGENGEAVIGGQISIVWLGLSRFLFQLSPEVNDRQDQLIVLASTASDAILDFTQVTVVSLIFAEEFYALEKTSDTSFLVIRKPSTSQVLIEAPADSYTADDGRRNSRAFLNYSVTAFSPRITITIVNQLLSTAAPLEFYVTSNSKLVTFDSADLEFGLRDSNLDPVAGFGQSGTLLSFTEEVEGYQWRGVYQLNSRITTQLYRYFVYFNNSSDQANLFGDVIPAGAQASVLLAPPLSVLVEPRTFEPRQTVIRFRVLFSTDLSASLSRSFLEFTNGALDAGSPGQGFVQVTNREYQVYVKPSVTGNVVLRVPADVVSDISGQLNLEGEGNLDWIEWFDVTGTLTYHEDKADVLKLTLTGLPAGAVPPTGLTAKNALIVNDWLVDDSYLPVGMDPVEHIAATFEWLIRVYPEKGSRLPNPTTDKIVRVSLRPDITRTPDLARNNEAVIPEFKLTVLPSATLEVSQTPVGLDDTLQVDLITNFHLDATLFTSPATEDQYRIFAGMNGTFKNSPPFQGKFFNIQGNYWADQTVTEPGYHYTWNILVEEMHLDRFSVNKTIVPPVSNAGYSEYSNEVFLAQYTPIANSYIDAERIVPIEELRTLSFSTVDITDTRSPFLIDVPTSQVQLAWTNTAVEPARYLIVAIKGDREGKTNAFTVDWGDTNTEVVPFSSALLSTTDIATFNLTHTYVGTPNAQYQVVITASAVDLAVHRVSAARIRLNGTYRELEPGQTGWSSISRIRQGTPVVGDVSASPARSGEMQDLAQVALGNNIAGLAVAFDDRSVYQSLEQCSGVFVPGDAGSTSSNYSPIGVLPFNMLEPNTLSLRKLRGLRVKSVGAKIWQVTGQPTINSFAVGVIKIPGFSRVMSGLIDVLEYLSDVDEGSNANSPVNLSGSLPGVLSIRTKLTYLRIISQTPEYIVEDCNGVIIDDYVAPGPYIYVLNSTVKYSLARTGVTVFSCNWEKNVTALARFGPLQVVSLIDHRMSFQDEYTLFDRLYRVLQLCQQGIYTLVPNISCQVVLQRLPGLVLTPEEEDLDLQIEQRIATIRLQLSALNRTDAFQITRE